MLSRIFWISLAGVALIVGIATQEREWLLAGAGDIGDIGIGQVAERAIDARVEQAVERQIDRAQVVDSSGRTVDVARDTKRELGDSVRRLVAAETELATMALGDSSESALRDARSRRDAARAEVERLAAQIERQEQLSEAERDRVREQIQREVRETVRETVRSVVRS